MKINQTQSLYHVMGLQLELSLKVKARRPHSEFPIFTPEYILYTHHPNQEIHYRIMEIQIISFTSLS